MLYYLLLTEADAPQLPVEHNTTQLGIQATYVMDTSKTTQARHDCEKIAITGLEPASQTDLASSQAP